MKGSVPSVLIRLFEWNRINNIYVSVYIYIYNICMTYFVCRFILRIWLTWLWSLRSPKMCIPQAGNLRVVGLVLICSQGSGNQDSHWHSYSPEQAGSWLRRSQFFSLSPKAGEDWCFSPAVWQEFSLPVSLFVLFWNSIYQVMTPTHIREDRLFTVFTVSQINVIQNQPQRDTQNNVWPKVWVCGGPVRLTPSYVFKAVARRSPVWWTNGTKRVNGLGWQEAPSSVA